MQPECSASCRRESSRFVFHAIRARDRGLPVDLWHPMSNMSSAMSWATSAQMRLVPLRKYMRRAFLAVTLLRKWSVHGMYDSAKASYVENKPYATVSRQGEPA